MDDPTNNAPDQPTHEDTALTLFRDALELVLLYAEANAKIAPHAAVVRSHVAKVTS